MQGATGGAQPEPHKMTPSVSHMYMFLPIPVLRAQHHADQIGIYQRTS